MSPTERIAQTFPDIDSQGLNTSGTAAGVRSFPQPFVGVTSGVDILIQNGSGTIVQPATSVPVAIGTSVDVTRSIIRFRGCNVASDVTTAPDPAGPVDDPPTWRLRLNFTSIVGGMSSTVTVRRGTSFRGSTLTGYFTVITFDGANTDSGDIRIERGMVTVAAPSTGGDIILAGPQLTSAELLRSFCFIRGVDFRNLPFPAGSCASGTGTACWKHPEQHKGTVMLVNSGPDTVIRYSRFTPGSTIGPDHCGNSDVIVHATAVIFP